MGEQLRPAIKDCVFSICDNGLIEWTQTEKGPFNTLQQRAQYLFLFQTRNILRILSHRACIIRQTRQESKFKCVIPFQKKLEKTVNDKIWKAVNLLANCKSF